MSRSLNPKAYPNWMFQLLQAMPNHSGEPFQLTLPTRKEATLLRNLWLSFRKSLANAAFPTKRAMVQPTPEELSLYKDLSAVAEKIQCNCEPPLTSPLSQPSVPHRLIFEFRDQKEAHVLAAAAVLQWIDSQPTIEPLTLTLDPPPAIPHHDDMSWWTNQGPSSDLDADEDSTT